MEDSKDRFQNMNGFRSYVIWFIERRMKEIICKDFECSFASEYGQVSFYRQSSPKIFLAILQRDHPGWIIKADTWSLLFNEVPKDLHIHGRYRCFQVICEYAAAYYGTLRDVLPILTFEVISELRQALAFFYTSFEYRTCRWMHVALSFDVRLFQQFIHWITTKSSSEKKRAAFKRSLVYAHQIYKSPRRIYLDSVAGQELPILRQIRRAYEHILFGTHLVDELRHEKSILKSITKMHHCHSYPNSMFTYADLCSRKGERKRLIIWGRGNCLDLVLKSPNLKPFPINHYRGALELISSCSNNLDVVYVDSRLDHNLLGNYEDFCFDAATFFPQEQGHKELLRHFSQRLCDYETDTLPNENMEWTDDVSPYVPPYLHFCHKEKLIDDDLDVCENNLISADRHIRDFLLWIISENPTVI